MAPLPIGFAVFIVHLATIPITGTGINPARSLGAAIIYNKDHSWDDHVSPNYNNLDDFFLLFANLFYWCLVVACFALAVDILGGTIHRSSSCGSLPPACHQSYSFQDQNLISFVSFMITLCCFYLLFCLFPEPENICDFVSWICFASLF